VNELYLSYSKGPLFLRIGRQSISWGESDTIALLDQNNPFDITLGVPGLLQDLDEARIPLWTVRSTLRLFDTVGPFASGFVEAYWVRATWTRTRATRRCAPPARTRHRARIHRPCWPRRAAAFSTCSSCS